MRIYELEQSLKGLRKIITSFRGYSKKEKADVSFCKEISRSLLLQNKSLFLTKTTGLHDNWDDATNLTTGNLNSIANSSHIDIVNLLKLNPFGDWDIYTLLFTAKAITKYNSYNEGEAIDIAHFFMDTFKALEDKGFTSKYHYAELVLSLEPIFKHDKSFHIVRRNIENPEEVRKILDGAKNYSLLFGVEELIDTMAPLNISILMRYLDYEPKFIIGKLKNLHDEAKKKNRAFIFLSEMIYLHYNEDSNTMKLFKELNVFMEWENLASENSIDTNEYNYKTVIKGFLSRNVDKKHLTSYMCIIKYIRNCDSEGSDELCEILFNLRNTTLISELKALPDFEYALECMLKKASYNESFEDNVSRVSYLRRNEGFMDRDKIKLNSAEKEKKCILASLDEFKRNLNAVA